MSSSSTSSPARVSWLPAIMLSFELAMLIYAAAAAPRGNAIFTPESELFGLVWFLGTACFGLLLGYADDRDVVTVGAWILVGLTLIAVFGFSDREIGWLYLPYSLLVFLLELPPYLFGAGLGIILRSVLDAGRTPRMGPPRGLWPRQFTLRSLFILTALVALGLLPLVFIVRNWSDLAPMAVGILVADGGAIAIVRWQIRSVGIAKRRG